MASVPRRDDKRDVDKDYSWFYALLVGTAVLGVGVWIGASMFNADTGYGMNLFTELLGIGGTVFIIDQLRAYRDNENLKRRLVREAGSRSNDIAISAVDWLRDKGWLVGDDGLLKEEKLSKANLQGADLSNANLQGANLNDTNLREVTLDNADLQGASLYDADMRGAYSWDANLQGAMMWNVMLQSARMGNANLQNASLDCARLQEAELMVSNLQRATMYRANLQRSDLRKTDLNNTDLRFADLEEANLWKANVQGANLLGANLQGVNLAGANMRGANMWHANLHGSQFYETTIANGQIDDQLAILPDGTEYTKDVKIEKFTDRDHPEYKETLEKINEIRRAMEIRPLPY